MKKLFLFSLFVCIGILQCLADDFSYTDNNGVTWGCSVTSEDNKTVRIYSASNYGDVVVIPEKVYKGTSDEYTVTDLGFSFSDNKTLESVTLPKTVTVLNSLFTGCSSLREVLNTSQIKTIGWYAFNGCSNLTKVDLSSCVSIDYGAFSGCSNLISVGNLSNCTSIGGNAFYGCTKLQDVGDLSNCKSIGEDAFYSCSSLKKLSGLKLTFIPNSAFNDCSSLESIDLSECTSIGSYAFYDCSSLTEVDLSSCKSIGNSVFRGCSNLSNVIGTEKLKKIPNEAFSGTALKAVSLPLCTSVGAQAFSDCSSLESIDLSECTSIGNSAFSGCSKLSNVDIKNCQSIGSSAFYNCSNLESIDLSECTSIGNSAFSGCSKLSNVDIKNCESIGSSVFEGCSSLTEVDLSSCKILESAVFRGCSKLSNVIGIEKFKNIPDNAFYGTALQSVSLPLCTSIGGGAFSYCSSLTTLDLPKVETIGDQAFQGTMLKTVSLPLCTSIGNWAFADCTSLTTLDLPKVEAIGYSAFISTALQSVSLPLCKYIDNQSFFSCKSLSIIDIPNVVTLGNYAFQNTAITKVSLPESLKTMGYGCFNQLCEYTFNGTTPAILSEDLSGNDWIEDKYYNRIAFGNFSIIKVPQSAVSTYKSADIWSKYADKIFSMSDRVDYDVTTTAMEKQSGLEQVIGATNMLKVVSLKAKGTINSYDIMMIRNKMTNLHCLDLSEADIVANDYEYYTGYHTTNNVVGDYMFYDLVKLVTVKLPNSVTYIGSHALSGCDNIEDIVLPENLTEIGSDAFECCSNLKSVQFPPMLKYIGSWAFSSCSNLQEIELPGLETISDNAFSSCYSLKEVRIPSTIKSIGNGAFSNCTNLSKVYTYTVEPTKISQNTFDTRTYENAHLCMPTQSYTNYYYNTEWSQFRNDNYEWFDEPYKYMYINKEYTLSDENSASKDKGRFDGDPDIDINPGGGLIVEGDKPQTSDEIHLKGDGSNWASIIASANVDAKKLYIDITVKANRWHFFCFPFDIKRSNISCGGSFVFRYYDGKIRATEGKGGWQNLPASEEYLKAGKGYIFQASVDCTLSILVEKEKFGMLPNLKFDCNLEANASTNEQNASWNFVGNPFTSFFDLNDMGYNAPVTRWNSYNNSYEAVRPGDDDYIFHPFEAFFVQRPTDSENIEFDPEHRMTQTGRDKRANANALKAMKRTLNPERLLVNLSISDGKNADKTRIVFNKNKSNRYEMDCDAAKFESNASAVLLYSVEAQGGKLAINERPKGSVQLGYVATKAGEFTISAQRMDQPVILRDNLMNVSFDLSNGDYNFTSEAGTFDNRFMLLVDGGVTGIADIANGTGVNIMPVEGGLNITGIGNNAVNVYSLSGVLLATRSESGLLSLPKATYVVEVGKMKAKVAVR